MRQTNTNALKLRSLRIVSSGDTGLNGQVAFADRKILIRISGQGLRALFFVFLHLRIGFESSSYENTGGKEFEVF